jgi:hypothetical protein
MGVAEPRMSQEECLLIFNKHIHTFESIEPVELDMFLKAVHLLFKDLVDYDSYKQYYKDFSDDLDVIIVSNKMPYKALGVEIKDKTKRKSVINAISQFLYFEKWVEDDNVTDDEQQTKMLENMKEEYGDIPIFSFLEFIFFKDGNEFETQKNLEEYMNKFPDYPIFKISAMAHSVTKILGENPEAEIIPLHTFYPNRYRFHISEMQEYIMYGTIIAAIGNNNPRMAAFFDILIDLEYPDEIFENVFPIISVQKIKAVKSSLGLPD